MYALQAIETKYLGPTNHRGSRVKASCEAGQTTVSWDYSLNVVENHARAATHLCRRLGWDERYPAHIGATKSGYVVVLTSRDNGTQVTAICE